MIIYRETVDCGKPNNQAVYFNDEPSLNHDKNKNNWSILLSFSREPGFDCGDIKPGKERISSLTASLFIVFS